MDDIINDPIKNREAITNTFAKIDRYNFMQNQLCNTLNIDEKTIKTRSANSHMDF